MQLAVAVLFLICFAFECREAISISTVGQKLNSRFKALSANNYSYHTEYFETFIDHFNFANDDKFKVKYLINEDHYAPGGAILFYTGNEGAIEGFADNTGIMWHMAPKLQATLIFMEHRYYGDSLPFGNQSYTKRDKFAFFTAEQALADYASFLQKLKATNPKYSHAPVIAIGGSYGGMLAAWFRAKYPNLISGALAASAPVLGFPNMTDCSGFMKTLTNAFASTGSLTCVKAIRRSWDVLAKTSMDKLTSNFKLCSALPSATILSDYLNEFYGEIGMVNYPYAANFLDDYPAWPVRQFCAPFDDKTEAELNNPQLLIHLLSEGLMNNKNYSGKLTCLNLNTGPVSLGIDGWNLQTCMEMQLPICSNGITDMFQPQDYDPVDVSNTCARAFQGLRPRLDWADTVFWGKNIPSDFSKVIYSNGMLDPWSPMGVLDPHAAPGCVVLQMRLGAHHLDLREPNPKDPQEVTEVRTKEWNLINSWIQEHYLILYHKYKSTQKYDDIHL
ncbi:hypothetical protein Ciccas_000861 [Cichlidogyrus casuarinus]|uniref:Lysosomal Pro-X carboxypeptidase n=1 Tax=Cichlidogyrus casuarinus TaxID=1844966 RepID=A0ABD2QLP4_9PLAT